MNKDAKIYVAGHTGLIGSAFLRKLKSKGYSQIVVLSRSQLDLRSENCVERFFEETRPEYVFLAAGRSGGIVGPMHLKSSFDRNCTRRRRRRGEIWGFTPLPNPHFTGETPRLRRRRRIWWGYHTPLNQNLRMEQHHGI